jgi:peptidoglycan-associated lipoprotein
MNWMSPRVSRVGLIVLLIAAMGLATGCARRATQVPPGGTTTPPADTTPPSTTPAPGDGSTSPSPGDAGEVSANDFQPVFFDYDSSTLRDDARTALDANARTMREHPNVRVTVEGHCDERGTIEYNQALGERRAQSAVEYLVAAGISGDRMDVVSYGKERPFDMGHDERAWALNRRAHFAVR